MPTYDSQFVFYDAFAVTSKDGTIDIDTDTIKVALFTSSYTPSASSDTQYGSLTNEVANANGYTTGGATITNTAMTQTGGAGKFDGDDVTWTASGGSIVARYWVMYSDTATNKDLIAYGLIDYNDLDVTTTDTYTLTISWNSSGIFTVAMFDA